MSTAGSATGSGLVCVGLVVVLFVFSLLIQPASGQYSGSYNRTNYNRNNYTGYGSGYYSPPDYGYLYGYGYGGYGSSYYGSYGSYYGSSYYGAAYGQPYGPLTGIEYGSYNNFCNNINNFYFPINNNNTVSNMANNNMAQVTIENTFNNQNPVDVKNYLYGPLCEFRDSVYFPPPPAAPPPPPSPPAAVVVNADDIKPKESPKKEAPPPGPPLQPGFQLYMDHPPVNFAPVAPYYPIYPSMSNPVYVPPAASYGNGYPEDDSNAYMGDRYW